MEITVVQALEALQQMGDKRNIRKLVPRYGVESDGQVVSATRQTQIKALSGICGRCVNIRPESSKGSITLGC